MIKKKPKKLLASIDGVQIMRNHLVHLPYNAELELLAREKRKAGILSEVLFWQEVQRGLFYKIDFDRQRVIGNYIVDFYVKSLGLVVEIDGDSHLYKLRYDEQRQRDLESYGIRVFRILDIDIKTRLGECMIALKQYIIREYGEEEA